MTMGVKRAALLALGLMATAYPGHARVSPQAYLTKYFPDELPITVEAAQLSRAQLLLPVITADWSEFGKVAERTITSHLIVGDATNPPPISLFLRLPQSSQPGLYYSSSVSDRAMPMSSAKTEMDHSGDACAARFAAFVEELDSVLSGDARAVDPILALFAKYLPVEGCNIYQVLDVARQSRFFASAGENPRVHIVSFYSVGQDHPGFSVQVSFERNTGNSVRPFVKINGY